jgi:putative hydrolase of the HAD superfamily
LTASPVTGETLRGSGGLVSSRGVLFDLGGTLDGDGVHWATRFREAYGRRGVTIPPSRFDAAFAEADRRIAARDACRDCGLRELLATQVAEQMEVLGLDDPALQSSVVADVYASASAGLAQSRQVLASLRPHVSLGVVSNFTGSLERVCLEAGLLPLVGAVVDSARVGVAKPDPEIFRLAARRLGLAPAECAVVGDSFDRDVVPAKAAGMRAVWLRGRSPRPCPDASLPDAIAASLLELPVLLGIARA